MNIEFTVEDYFKELQLMEAQYGQEEELYPWIYMLLQMVESKKVQPGKKYAPISIRVFIRLNMPMTNHSKNY